LAGCTLISIPPANFLRRNAEMEREIAELRRRLATNPNSAHAVEAAASDEMSQCSEDVYCGPESANPNRARTMSTKLEPQALATPLTMHSDRSILSQDDDPWRLEDVTLSRQRVARLFDQYVMPCSLLVIPPSLFAIF
jgi:hypothetical protein